jgi:hypothetical protein
MNSKKLREMEMAYAVDRVWMAESEINIKIQAMVDFDVLKPSDITIKKVNRSQGSGFEISGSEKSISIVSKYICDNLNKYKNMNNAEVLNANYEFLVSETPTSLIFEYIFKRRG